MPHTTSTTQPPSLARSLKHLMAREREKKRRIVQDGVCWVRGSELHETVRERYLFQVVPTTFSDRRLDSPRFEEATHLQRWESFQAGENQWFLTQFDRRTAGFQDSLLRKQPGEQPSFLLRKSVGNLFLFPLFQYHAASAPLVFSSLIFVAAHSTCPFPHSLYQGGNLRFAALFMFRRKGFEGSSRFRGFFSQVPFSHHVREAFSREKSPETKVECSGSSPAVLCVNGLFLPVASR